MIKFSDALSDVTTSTHKDGYKVVKAKVARTGVQSYLRREFGDYAPVGNPDDVLKIYRPPSEVFSDDAVNGWAHVPVTIDHPADLVSPDNYKDLAVGEVTSRAKIGTDDGWLSLEFLLKDAAAIKASETTHKQYSGGYTADIDFTKGVTPTGESYDGIQRAINPNHLALVPKGRAFKDALHGDAKPWGITPQSETKKEPTMDLIKVMVGDKAVQVAATDADFIAKMVKDHQSALDTKDETIGELKAECAEATAKILTDAQIDELVTAKAEATARREAVRAKFGDEAVKDATDAEIKGIYSVMDKTPAKVDPVRKALADAKPGDADPWAAIIDKMKGK